MNITVSVLIGDVAGAYKEYVYTPLSPAPIKISALFSDQTIFSPFKRT